MRIESVCSIKFVGLGWVGGRRKGSLRVVVWPFGSFPFTCLEEVYRRRRKKGKKKKRE